MPFDFKKDQKELYGPKSKPMVVDVPEMTFLMIDGRGDPNTSQAYSGAVETLYGLSYAIRMNKDWPGYFEYVVAPLEGLWSVDDAGFTGPDSKPLDKSEFSWTAMIRQPDFVSEAVFEQAKAILAQKKPHLDLSGVRLEAFTEGLCCQILHTGPYDTEADTIRCLDAYAREHGFLPDMSSDRRHHEIYLGDPRKVAEDKLRTVIRHPVKSRV